ncbi:MAG: endonuclease/exonuclease/phosphatase family protein [Gillisia sp.]
MKNLRLFDKVLFLINALLALALLSSYLIPFVPPQKFPLLSVLSLGVPVLILSNFIFLIYWILRLKKQVLLPLLVLIIGYNYVFSWIAVNFEQPEVKKNSLKLMSYNVRMFNSYKWTSQKDIPQKISSLVAEKDPDVLATQEHSVGESKLADMFPYRHIVLKEKASEFGSALFSKYPIIHKGSVDFPQDGNNNAIWIDIVKQKDTLRVFNVHFQSLRIKAGIDELRKEDSKKLVGRIGYGFQLQQSQAEMLVKELEKSPYKTILLGDFNNTAFSYIYKLVKGDRFNDAFLTVGNGFGQTFNLNYFPLRIDFMLIDKSIKIDDFKVFRVNYSDHFPIFGRIEW